MSRHYTIIGGGIAGLTTSIALKQIGIATTIFESAPSIKAVGAGLGLGANAIMAFKRLGIADEVIRRGRILPSFSIYDQKGNVITYTDSKKTSAAYGVDNFTIHRAELHEFLLSKIDASSIHTNKKVTDIDQQADSVVITFQDGTTHITDYLLVADGIHSAVRKKILPEAQQRYAGYTCWRAVIDNTALKLEETSETWGPGKRFGIVPLANNKIYWFACINAPQNDARRKNYSIKDLRSEFGDFHEPIPSILLETKDENLIWNDIIDLKPIDKYAFNNIVLLGDAAHATTPNMGQGACQAIEDAVVLADEIAKQADITIAFKNFEKRRLKRTHYITNNSWTIGKVAQVENRIAATVRNFLFRLLPASVNEKQLKILYEVDF